MVDLFDTLPRVWYLCCWMGWFVRRVNVHKLCRGMLIVSEPVLKLYRGGLF